jgi:acyl-CoA hydrolase
MSDPRLNRAISVAELAALVPNGAKAFVHGAAMTPVPLLDALAARTDVEGVTLYHLHTAGTDSFVAPAVAGRIRSVSFFAAGNVRKAIAEGRADYLPIFLADIPRLFLGGTIPLDVALVQVSPPDRHGLVSLGTSVDAALAAVMTAKKVFALVNPQVPRTHGAAAFPFSKIDAFAVVDRPLIAHEAGKEPTEVEGKIGQEIANLVVDGATLQMGIGAIPDAVLTRLGGKNDLGVHTEMFSDHLVPLLESGVVNNRRKNVYPGISITSFVNGTKKVFDYVDDNPMVQFHPCNHTNDTLMIRKNDNVVAINSAIEIDLTGQVCADSMGFSIYSGIGGQMDFIRGAALSKGGKPILALPSTGAKGTVSRIVPSLKPGAGVVTTRGHVHYVVTEYGTVNLVGKTLRERAEALIAIAHPDFRAELRRAVADVRHYSLA